MDLNTQCIQTGGCAAPRCMNYRTMHHAQKAMQNAQVTYSQDVGQAVVICNPRQESQSSSTVTIVSKPFLALFIPSVPPMVVLCRGRAAPLEWCPSNLPGTQGFYSGFF